MQEFFDSLKNYLWGLNSLLGIGDNISKAVRRRYVLVTRSLQYLVLALCGVVLASMFQLQGRCVGDAICIASIVISCARSFALAIIGLAAVPEVITSWYYDCRLRCLHCILTLRGRALLFWRGRWAGVLSNFIRNGVSSKTRQARVLEPVAGEPPHTRRFGRNVKGGS